MLAPLGYVVSPSAARLVHASPEVRAAALPYLRTMFVCSLGQLLYFMIAGALRAAGDARTGLRIGMWIVGLNVALNMVLIRGLGADSRVRRAGRGARHLDRLDHRIGRGHLADGDRPRRRELHEACRGGPTGRIIRALFRFGLPAGVQGVAMNVAGVLLLRFMGSLPYSAEAQAAYAVCYTELFSFITWTSVGLMGAAAAIAGQNLGAGRPERSVQAVQVAARFGLMIAGTIGVIFLLFSDQLLAFFGLDGSDGRADRTAAAALPERVGSLHHRRADLHRRTAGHRRHQEPALHHARRADRVPLGLCFYLRRPASSRRQGSGWRSCSATSPALRASRRGRAFPPGKWKHIADIPETLDARVPDARSAVIATSPAQQQILEVEAEVGVGRDRAHLHGVDRPSGVSAKVTNASARSSRSVQRATNVSCCQCSSVPVRSGVGRT